MFYLLFISNLWVLTPCLSMAGIEEDDSLAQKWALDIWHEGVMEENFQEKATNGLAYLEYVYDLSKQVIAYDRKKDLSHRYILANMVAVAVSRNQISHPSLGLIDVQKLIELHENEFVQKHPDFYAVVFKAMRHSSILTDSFFRRALVWAPKMNPSDRHRFFSEWFSRESQEVADNFIENFSRRQQSFFKSLITFYRGNGLDPAVIKQLLMSARIQLSAENIQAIEAPLAPAQIETPKNSGRKKIAPRPKPSVTIMPIQLIEEVLLTSYLPDGQSSTPFDLVRVLHSTQGHVFPWSLPHQSMISILVSYLRDSYGKVKGKPVISSSILPFDSDPQEAAGNLKLVRERFYEAVISVVKDIVESSRLGPEVEQSKHKGNFEWISHLQKTLEADLETIYTKVESFTPLNPREIHFLNSVYRLQSLHLIRNELVRSPQDLPKPLNMLANLSRNIQIKPAQMYCKKIQTKKKAPPSPFEKMY